MLKGDLKSFIAKTNIKNKKLNGNKIRFNWTRRKRKG